MKKHILGISAVCALLFGFTACDEERVNYEGPNYVMFSDTLQVLPVQNSETYFDVTVAATQACDYDRTFGVEVLEQKSNAIEGYHYAIEDPTIVIKAGERAANVRVRGIYDHIGIGDSIGFVMQLVDTQDVPWEAGSNTTKVVLQKCCPFDINAFVGYARITSTYIQQYMQNISFKLVVTELDPTEENTIVMKDYFYDGCDMKIKFTTDDPLNPLIRMEDQKFANTSDAFGTIYGYGEIMAYSPTAYASYYSSCENFIYQYMTLHVPGMAEGDVTVGTFINAVEWISEDEYNQLKKEGY